MADTGEHCDTTTNPNYFGRLSSFTIYFTQGIEILEHYTKVRRKVEYVIYIVYSFVNFVLNMR